ncbi:tetratricopeptide repeat protein [Chloroflexota bacterium]
MSNEDVPELLSIWDEARGHIGKGDYNKAIETYKYVLVMYSDNDVAVEFASAYLGDLYLTMRRFNLAEKHLEKAIRLAPEKAHYHYLLGFISSVGEHWAKAVKEFEKALELDPYNGEYERGLGWAVFNGGDRGNGLSHLYRAIELYPTNTNALTDLATAMMMLGNMDKAKEYGERAVQADPGNVLAHRLLERVEDIERIQRREG